MRVADSLVALEGAVEKALLGFFVLLGSGAAPENWQPALQDVGMHQEERDTMQNQH